MFVAYCPCFGKKKEKKMKVGLCELHAVCFKCLRQSLAHMQQSSVCCLFHPSFMIGLFLDL
jgi:hypothetical protein